MGVDSVKDIIKDILNDLNGIEGKTKGFKQKYEDTYAHLIEARNEGLKNLEESKKNRSDKHQKEVNRQIKSLEIIFKKEDEKHKNLIENIDAAIEKAKTIKNNANKIGTKQSTVTISEIQEEINSLIPFLQQVFTNSQFIITRIIKSQSYVLAQQPELVAEKLNYPKGEEKKLLVGEMANLFAKIPIFEKARGGGAAVRFGLSSKIKDLEERKSTNWSSPTTLDKLRLEENKKIIKEHLTDISPDKLHTIPKNVQEIIQKYIYGRNIARQAAYNKNNPHPESEIEKLIYAKTGMRGEEIVGREVLFPKPDTEGLTNKKPVDIASSPAEVKPKVERKKTTKLTDVISDAAPVVNTSPIADIKPGTAQEKISSPSEMTKALTPYIPPVNKSSPVSVSSALPPMSEVLNQHLGVSQHPIPLSNLSQNLLGQTNTNTKGKTSGGTSKGRSVLGTGGVGGGSIGGGTGQIGNTANLSNNGIIDVRIVEIIPQPLDSLKTIFHSAMAQALDYYSASPKIRVHLESIGNSISQLLSSLFNQNSSANPGQTNPNQSNTGTTNPGSTGGSGAKGKKGKSPISELDPFQKRLKKIYEEGREEITLLYAKVNSYLPIFTNAQVEAKKTALNTLKEGYRAFNVIYQRTGSSFKGMMAAINKMFKISPATVILAGMTVAFTGILSAANRLNNRIKEISAELGTSNMQSYELFKNAMNAQTQYDNMYASLRDIRDVQKGILGDSGILLQTNDKALASVADNAKNIGLSVESAGAFYENLRMKGGSDKEASNLMAASLELADKKGFSPQSIVDDIAQNAEFASKYFSNINKHSKSAHRNLIETNLQVKALGLNFQKAAKMTQHLLSFEQSIVAEVEASVALGRHVNIGKARELLLQDDIAGAMTQMMDTMGGYDEFQNMDFAKRQLMANAIGMEVSELEKSLYLREKIGLKDAESLDAAMRNSDYLDKVAGKDVELYKIETKKVMAAERFNTAIEKVSVAFKSSLLPILEAIVPIVDHMAWAINLVAGTIKTIAGLPGKLYSKVTGAQAKQDGSSNTPGLDASMALGMTAVMGGLLLKTIRGKIGGKIGEAVGKARGGFDAISGTLGSKSNPMYVQVVGGILGGGAGSVASTILDNAGGATATGTAGASRFSKVKDFLSRGAGKVKSIASGGLSKAQDLFSRGAGRLKGFSAGAPEKIGKAINSLKNIKPSSIAKIGGVMAVAGAAFDYAQRKKEGQSTKQAATASVGGALGGIASGAVSGAAMGAFLGPIGAAIGGLIGGTAGYLATTKIIDSHFDKNKSSSFTAQPFMYAGMNGISGGGGISTSLNKPKATGTPVETSMVDMTPTTFKSMSTGLSGITPNYGMTSMSRESVMVNSVSKSLEATALMNSVKEKNIEKEKAHKELMQQQLKILESIREKINQPAVAFFTDEGRRQVINHSRVKNSH